MYFPPLNWWYMSVGATQVTAMDVEENEPMDRERTRRLLKQVVILTEKEVKRKHDIIIQLRKIADELDVKQRDMNIAKTAFASSGLTGLTIAGIVAAPFTFGASLGLTIGGVAVGVSSGLGGLATTIADWIINSNTMKEAQAMVDDYQETVNSLVKLLQQVKRSNSADFQSLMSEELADMDTTQRLTLESILTGMKTGVEVLGSAGRSTAVVGAVAARATMAAGKTMMETLETGIKAVKIGGVVLSVLTVPLDLHTMITNSMKIHNNTPSETAEEIRKLATHLEKYRMVSPASQGDDHRTQTAKEELKTLKQEVKKAIPDLRKMEKHDEINRRSRRKLREHLTRLVKKVPRELDELAVRYDQSNHPTNVLKLLCLAVQVFGTALIAFGILSDMTGMQFEYVLKYGVMVVIGSGIAHLTLEMYTEMTNSSLWKDAETKLERYVHTIQVLTDLNGPDAHHHYQVEDIFDVFRRNLHNGYYMRGSYRDFILIAFKLLLDVCALFVAGSGGDSRHALMINSEVHSGLISVESALSLVSYPIVFFTDIQLWAAGTLVYLLTLPVTVYLLLLRLREIHGTNTSNIAEAMKNLGEDFCIRFNDIFPKPDS